MSLSWRRRAATCLAVLVLVGTAASAAFAQQADIPSIERKYQEFYASDNLPAALAEARKLETAIRAQFGILHANYGLALWKLANVYLRQGQYAEAEPLFESALAIIEGALGANHPHVAGILSALASGYQAQGKFADAESLYKRALAITERIPKAGDAELVRALDNLLSIYGAQGKNAELTPVYKRKLDIKERMLGARHSEVADILNDLATVYHGQGAYAEAEPLYQRALQIYQDSPGPPDQDIARTLHNLALAYQAQGKFAEAGPLYQRALAIKEKLVGVDSPELVGTLNNLISVYQAQGKAAELPLLYKRLLAIKEKSLGAGHPDVAEVLSNLANAYYGQKAYAEAQPLYKRALEIYEKNPGAGDTHIAWGLANLARTYYMRDELPEAEMLYKRALTIREKSLSSRDPAVVSLVDILATVYLGQDKAADAERLYQHALSTQQKEFGADHPSIINAINELAQFYRVRDRHDDAERLYKNALAIREKEVGVDKPETVGAINNLAKLYQGQGNYASAEYYYLRALALKEKAFGADSVEIIDAVNNLAEHYEIQAGHLDADRQHASYLDAEKQYKRVLAIKEKSFGADNPEIADALNTLAKFYRDRSNYPAAEEQYKRALAIKEAKLGADNPQIIDAIDNLAFLYWFQNKYDSVEPLYRRVLAIREKNDGADNPEALAAMERLANHYQARNKFAEAESLFKRALSIREKAADSDRSGLVETINKLAGVYESQEKYAEAEKLYLDAVAIREQTVEDETEHDKLFASYEQLQTFYRKQNRGPEQERTYKRASTFFEKLLGKAGGPPNIDLIASLTSLASLAESAGSYGDSEVILNRALKLREQQQGAIPDVEGLGGLGYRLDRLVETYEQLGRDDDARIIRRRLLAIQRRQIEIRERAYTKAARWATESLIDALVRGAELSQAVHEDDGAIALFKRARQIKETASGKSDAGVVRFLAPLTLLYRQLGRSNDEQAARKEILAICDQQPIPGREVSRLIRMFKALDRPDEAEQVVNRQLAMTTATSGSRDTRYHLLLALGELNEYQGHLAKAGENYQRALAVAKSYEHGQMAAAFEGVVLIRAMFVYRAQGREDEADRVLNRLLEIQQELGPREKVLLLIRGLVFQELRRFDEAEEALTPALLDKVTYDADLAIMRYEIAARYLELGADTLAMAHFRKATATIIATETAFAFSRKAAATIIGVAGGGDKSGSQGKRASDYARSRSSYLYRLTSADRLGGGMVIVSGEAEVGRLRRPDYFYEHVASLSAVSRKQPENASSLGFEAFEISQWDHQSSSASALQQVAARTAAGDGALSALVREGQDLGALWRATDKMLSGPNEMRDDASGKPLRSQLGDIEERIAAVASRLEKEFPDYAALANPKPLSVAKTQALLSADEALVYFLTGTNQTYVFALTRDGFVWQAIPFNGLELSEMVTRFRRGLYVDALGRAEQIGSKTGLFDLDLANELYATLLGPVETLVKEKRHLLVVPSGPLAALPFHLLVTEKPTTAIPPLAGRITAADMAPYRDASWLLKRQAVIILPSVTSLEALRGHGARQRARNPMIGFGDPVFGLEQQTPPPANGRAPQTTRAKAAAKNQPLAGPQPPNNGTAQSVPAGSSPNAPDRAGPDRKAIAAAQRLPDTAQELAEIARQLGAAPTDIHLRQAATETAVKRLPLADYRIVYFATHAVVADQVQGLSEPSLLLSWPLAPSGADDGVLTASEVTQLKLNADWVVLSACNTIAGDKAGGERLSGLARAFFYAGARALLVSHWAVDSSSATTLMISTFAGLKADPALSRSEALRRAMLAYLSDRSTPENAYPAFWGPFAVIGEGGALQ